MSLVMFRHHSSRPTIPFNNTLTTLCHARPTLLFKTNPHLLRPDLLEDLVHLPRFDGFAGDVYGVDAVAEDRKVELLADAVFHVEAVHRLCFDVG